MDDEERKEKVIHTRVSEGLDEEIRDRAARLGVSVSNLVRNVLQNAFGLVEDVVADAASIGRSARGEERDQTAPARGTTQAARVVGWQEAVLNVNALCEACNAILPRGTRAAIAVTEGAGPRPIRCLACLAEVTGDAGR
jgi:plasmid stability protein